MAALSAALSPRCIGISFSSLLFSPRFTHSCSIALSSSSLSRIPCVTKLPSPLYASAALALTIDNVLPCIALSYGSRIPWQSRGARGRIKQQKAFLMEGPRMFAQQGGVGLARTSSMAGYHLSPILACLRANPFFMSGFIAWTAAQFLKVFTTFFVERRWDLKMLVASGGMPSSHSALCAALTTSVALCHGLSDALFPICLGFSLIVMYDATGVRRHAGLQAEVLNVIVEDLFKAHPVSEKKLKELLGHTPLQVFAGAFLGILSGYLCSQACSVIPGTRL